MRRGLRPRRARIVRLSTALAVLHLPASGFSSEAEMFKKLFGGSKEGSSAPAVAPPSANAAAKTINTIQNLTEHEEQLEKRKTLLEKRIAAELEKAKELTKQGKKAQALQVNSFGGCRGRAHTRTSTAHALHCTHWAPFSRGREKPGRGRKTLSCKKRPMHDVYALPLCARSASRRRSCWRTRCRTWTT